MNKIKIKESKKGSLRSAMHAKKGSNLSVSAMSKKLHSKGVNPAMKKKLVFDMNARKWKKADGGLVEYMADGGITLGSWGDQSKTAGTLGGIGGMIGTGISAIDSMDGTKSVGGQMAGGALSGAAMGMALGPIGAGVGALIGGGVAGITTALGNKKAEEAEAAQQLLRSKAIQSAQVAANQGGSMYPPTFPMGGLVQGQPNVEVEKEEVSQAPDGSMNTFDLPSHANATSANQVAMQPGTRIFSDRLKTKGDKTIAEQADEIRKQIEKYEQILNS